MYWQCYRENELFIYDIGKVALSYKVCIKFRAITAFGNGIENEAT